MPVPIQTGTPDWASTLRGILDQGSVEERLKVFEYLSLQSELTSADAQTLLVPVQNGLNHSDQQIRYYARKALHGFKRWMDTGDEEGVEVPVATEGRVALSTLEILTHKLWLGSRYIAFDAMERLTATKDPSLADALIQYLDSATDPYKISYLVKRLGRIPDPRIPKIIEARLLHSDLRVRANAIEGLLDFNLPHLCNTFRELANSDDNRIRGNSVRALHKYAPEEAEQHLEKMLLSTSVALQDSAVFLLTLLRPATIDHLIELALNSQFVGIRMKALEVPKSSVGAIRPPSPSTGSVGAEGSDQQNFWGLAAAFLAACVLNVTFRPFGIAHLLILTGASLGMMAFAIQFRKTTLGKVGLSLAFLTLASDGRDSLLIVLALLIVWSVNAAHFFVWADRSRLYATGFVIIALTLCSILSKPYIVAVEGLEHLFTYFGKTLPVIEQLSSQKQIFFGALFFVISFIALFIIGIERFLGKLGGSLGSVNRFVLSAVLAGCLAILAMYFSQNLGIMTMLSTNGLSDPARLLKALTE